MLPDSTAENFDAEEFAACAGVSRETMERLKLYAAMLEDWNTRQNLVSEASLQTMWRRHFWDSAQLAKFIPKEAKSLVDLGAGAGFPGLVLAELKRDDPKFKVVLYEATAKKCRFLGAVAERLALDVDIRRGRIEDSPAQAFNVITARACAPLTKLLAYAQRFWGKDTVAVFLKGQNVEPELTQSHKSWRMQVERHPSRSDASGVILEIHELRRVADERKHSNR
jgi:16S rRNA (guanine527-N7)-methyltransferase